MHKIRFNSTDDLNRHAGTKTNKYWLTRKGVAKLVRAGGLITRRAMFYTTEGVPVRKHQVCSTAAAGFSGQLPSGAECREYRSTRDHRSRMPGTPCRRQPVSSWARLCCSCTTSSVWWSRSQDSCTQVKLTSSLQSPQQLRDSIWSRLVIPTT